MQGIQREDSRTKNWRETLLEHEHLDPTLPDACHLWAFLLWINVLILPGQFEVHLGTEGRNTTGAV